MFYNDIQNQLALLVKTSATPLIDVAHSPAETAQWVPGQQLPAHVISSLPNGRFLVMVQDQKLDMNLPRSTQPGDKLDLVYVSDKPRPTFALLGDIAKAITSNTTQVSLSQTGKLIATLPQQNAPGTATAVVKTTEPILPGAPVSVQQLVTALRDTISQSGLFYESHQAQWVTGSRPLESLLHEPQGKLAAVPVEQKPAVSVDQKSAVLPNTDGGKVVLNNQNSSPQQVQTSSFSVTNNTHTVAAASTQLPTDSTQQIPGMSSGTREAVHPLTAPLVQQQLDVLGNRQIVWQGQVWPGQDMEWTIEEDGHHQGSEAEGERTWSTKLHLDFPMLGSVTAHLVLAAGGVKMNFAVARESSAALLQTEASSLAQSMESSGLKVAGLMVRQDGQP